MTSQSKVLEDEYCGVFEIQKFTRRKKMEMNKKLLVLHNKSFACAAINLFMFELDTIHLGPFILERRWPACCCIMRSHLQAHALALPLAPLPANLCWQLQEPTNTHHLL